MTKVVVIGWDGVPPRIAFDDLLEHMPNLQSLLRTSTYGPLRSTKPPITIPAWMCMMTGCDPGQLGVYGFRHHKPGDYKGVWIPDSTTIDSEKIWDIVGSAGGKTIVIGIPPTYPPTEVRGILVSGFLAPDTEQAYTYPQSYKETIESVTDGYMLDVFYRTQEKDKLFTELLQMVKKRHTLAKHMLQNEEWDLFILMEIGPDRLHHGFWKYYDKKHDMYRPGNQYEQAFIDFYHLLDEQLGEILEIVPEDTLLLLVSDHGAKGRKGAFCINQWLQEQGYLKLVETLDGPKRFVDVSVDWSQTRAWGWGGYYSRIFINVEGYEEKGIVSPEDYETLRNELAEKLLTIKGPDGENWFNIVDRPEDIYAECKGDYPDLMVYFDNLYWRASSQMGHDSPFLYEEDGGPDDAVHDWDGIYVAQSPTQTVGKKESHSILDISPTILSALGLEIPEYMRGKQIRNE